MSRFRVLLRRAGNQRSGPCPYQDQCSGYKYLLALEVICTERQNLRENPVALLEVLDV
jgi:hypothetical protein